MQTYDQKQETNVNWHDMTVHFEEGLIGFSDYKDFVLMTDESLAPFQLLKSVDSPHVAFLVLEATNFIKNYCDRVLPEEWLSAGITDEASRMALIIVVIGPTLESSTGNLQAPLLINRNQMMGKQIVLTASGFSVRQPLLQVFNACPV